jgi:hypothetical protein
MRLLAVGVATALVYALWVAWVPLLPDNVYIPLLDLGKITGYLWQSALMFLAIVIGLYCLYAAGYWLVYRGGAATSLVFVIGAVFCLELLWAYPATAVDVFGYIADGRLLAQHQQNPFIVPPNAFPSDSILAYLAFPDEPSQYGPIWVLIGGAFASVAGGNLLLEVLLYKAAAVLAQVGGAALVYLIAGRLTRSTRAASASAYLYLWNPMLLWEMVGNAHNDGFMMLLGLLAVWLFVIGIDRLALVSIAAGALVKIPVALIAPVLFIGVWRRHWIQALEALGLAAALVFFVYRPFWAGPETLTVLHRTDLFTASLGSVLRYGLSSTLGNEFAASIGRTVSLTGFVIVAALAMLFAIRAQSDADILRAAYVTLLAGLLLATTWFQAWYVVWPFAIGACLGETRRHLEVALLSLGGLLQYFVFIYLWVMGYFPPTQNIGVQGAAFVAIIGPLAVGLAVRALAPYVLRARPLGRVPSGEYH